MSMLLLPCVNSGLDSCAQVFPVGSEAQAADTAIVSAVHKLLQQPEQKPLANPGLHFANALAILSEDTD